MADSACPSDPRRALARYGVALFHPSETSVRPSVAQLAALVRELAASDDARLVASVPCLLIGHHDRATDACAEVAAKGGDGSRRRLGLLYRLTRALANSRQPDLDHLFGGPRRLPPADVEDDSLPNPEEEYGERCLAIARERYEDDPNGNLVGDVEDLFDAWLRQAQVDKLAVSDA